MIRKSLVLAALALWLLSPLALAQVCPWEGNLPKVDDPYSIAAPDGMHLAMCNAYVITDPIEREVAIREVLVTYLLAEDIREVDSALEYVSRNERWLDLSPYSDVFERAAEIRRIAALPAIPMQSYLRRAPRRERVALYREALVSGSAKVGCWMQPLARETALGRAALDGIEELREEIEEAYPSARADYRKRRPLELLLMKLEVRAGGSDQEDAANKAAQRFAATSATEFRDRMGRDPIFARVFDETVKEVCAINPYDGSQSRGCGSILELYVHQNALVLSQRKQASVPGDAIAGVDRDSLPKWLRDLGGIRLEGEYFFRAFEKRCVNTAMSWDVGKCLQTDVLEGE